MATTLLGVTIGTMGFDHHSIEFTISIPKRLTVPDVGIRATKAQHTPPTPKRLSRRVESRRWFIGFGTNSRRIWSKH